MWLRCSLIVDNRSLLCKNADLPDSFRIDKPSCDLRKTFRRVAGLRKLDIFDLVGKEVEEGWGVEEDGWLIFHELLDKLIDELGSLRCVAFAASLFEEFVGFSIGIKGDVHSRIVALG